MVLQKNIVKFFRLNKQKMIKLKEIIEAKNNFNKNIVKHTKLELNKSLSEKYWANIFLKREDLQIVRSFKIRWAFNFVNSLSEKEKKMWIVCASAWNHAQWIAISCKELWVNWVIFMPQTTPNQKVRKTKKFWWEFIKVKLIWDNFNQAYEASIDFCKKNWSIFAHPFDDKKVIIWQATVWLEIIEDFEKKFEWEKIDKILVQIWWWWLISWVWKIFEELSPKTEIIWIESENSASMKLSIQNWKIETLEKIDTFCDWIAVKTPWKTNFEIIKKITNNFVKVPDWLTATALLWLLDDQWIITEPSWAIWVASLELMKEEIKWKNIVCIISWWNFDFIRLPNVEEKSLKFLWLKKYFIISFPQRPWALKDFLNLFWENDDISFFEYIKKSAKQNGPALVWIETNKKENLTIFIEKMKKEWIKYEEITNNELYFDFLI